MKKILLILTFVSSIAFSQNIGSTETPYDTQGWDQPVDSTTYYKFFIAELLSNPGGYKNLNWKMVDSLLNALVVFTDTTQLVIQDDTLRFSNSFVDSVVANATITVSADSAGHIDFNTSQALLPHQEGRLQYDSSKHAFIAYYEEEDFTQEIGREPVQRFYNASGALIPDGTPVYLDGVTGDLFNIIKADAVSTSEESARVIGFATHSIENGSIGYVTMPGGIIRGQNTSGYSPGDNLYLAVGGGVTDVPPTAPNHALRVGRVGKSSVSEGTIFVSPDPFNPVDARIIAEFSDLSQVIALTSGVESRITGGSDIFVINSTTNHGITESGDSLYLDRKGIYEADFHITFEGGTGDDYNFYLKVNGTAIPNSKGGRKTSSSDKGGTGFSTHFTANANDVVTAWVINIGNNNDITLKHCNLAITQIR